MTLFRGPAPAGMCKTMVSSLMMAAALATTLAAASPAMASASSSGAEKLRKLDIMLMVTSLRCRNTENNFTAEYGSFTTSHMTELNQANAELRQEIASRLGGVRAAMEMDRISTVMANAYGQGHPWLSCGELKDTARALAQAEGRATLEEAADQLLGEEGSTELAYARR